MLRMLWAGVHGVEIVVGYLGLDEIVAWELGIVAWELEIVAAAAWGLGLVAWELEIVAAVWGLELVAWGLEFVAWELELVAWEQELVAWELGRGIVVVAAWGLGLVS
jgi:hypothetical protein